MAEVIPLFGDPSAPARTPAPDSGWHEGWLDDDDDDPDSYDGEEGVLDECTLIEIEIAETLLLKKLRSRSLSVAESRAVLRERPLDAAQIGHIVDGFVRRGFLDDAALADQLIRAGVERKGQGRQVISLTLAKRGIPRDVADAALTALPDDDAERALDFARTKAARMASLDRDAAVRRLAGQLSRRGYSGSTAFAAANRALDELGSRSSVRFR